MAVVKALELAVALIALVTLPCAIAAMICADELIVSVRDSLRRRREHWLEQRTLHQMERSLTPPRAFLAPVAALFATAPTAPVAAGTGRGGVPEEEAPHGWLAMPAAVWASITARLQEATVPPPPPSASSHPPFERIAADLRRLGADRLGIGQRNDVWHGAVERAYDVKLREACRALGIAEHLEELTDMDREIERLRIEGELIAAGVRLR
ncbi:MAG: hypothetical protein HOV71_20790 [Hamadaea sp.]|uniref:hypothetical protein n=1 Tax=Hamadaea sp. NPDC050747 TaxID=3155789 RepID=UPI0017E25685|nr:hypothetical protein [Hamadaea sp.]NUR50572.1 hypothetical protein [Hamadaea sp.]NUT08134.1 hypothetical protein [Hamadaea sp.]